jgi:hypothetical protein
MGVEQALKSIAHWVVSHYKKAIPCHIAQDFKGPGQ